MAHPTQAQSSSFLPRQGYPSREAGFSLIELAIAVVIIGVMMTMGIAAMNAARVNQSFSETTKKAVSVRDALIGYLRTYKRLPCPDTDFTAPDGIENRSTPGDTTTACSARYGTLPYITLGLPRDSAQDGWGNFYSYNVSNTAGSNLDWTITANFNTGNIGDIIINDRRPDGTAKEIAKQVVVAIISHGPNGLGAYTIGGTRNTVPGSTTDEYLNANGAGGTTYYKRDATTDDAAVGGAIDDMVLFVTADDFLRPLFADGSLQSPAAIVNAQLQKIKLSLVGYAMSNSSIYGGSSCNDTALTPKCKLLPAANPGDSVPLNSLNLTSADATDPWGKPLIYTVHPEASIIGSGRGISSSLPLPTPYPIAFTVTSYGPDRAASTDDVTLTVSMSELRGLMSTLLP